MRDSLLAVAGHLEDKLYGAPVDITTSPYSRRRTLYAFIDRQNLPGLFRNFDFASPDATNPQRFQTTVPQQALFLLNSPFAQEQAKALRAGPNLRRHTRRPTKYECFIGLSTPARQTRRRLD